MKRVLSALLIVLVGMECALAGVAANKTMYVGGTANLKQGTQSILDVSDEKVVKFDTWQTPYDKVTALSYGQRVGRHWELVPLGLYGVLPILLTKKRRHYLTVEYCDDNGKLQAAIFEVGKDSIKATLKTLEVRSGKQVVYEDKEAQKTGGK